MTDPQIRADRFELRRPTWRDGRFHGEAVIASVGPLRYDWGVEQVDHQTLTESVDTVRGAPIIYVPPERADEYHWSTITPAQIEEWGIGHVGQDADVRGDDLAGSVVIDRPRGIAAIKSGLHGLSASYTVARVDNGVQRGRRVNHVLLTGNPRVKGAGLRADGEGNMDEIKAAIAALTAKVEALKAAEVRADADTTPRTDGVYRLAAGKWEPVDVEKIRADAAPSEATMIGYAKRRAELIGAAAEVKATIPDGATLDVIRSTVAKAIKPDIRADASADYLDALVDARQPARPWTVTAPGGVKPGTFNAADFGLQSEG